MLTTKLFADHARKKLSAYVFIRHDLSVVRYIANDIMVMHFGKMIDCGRCYQVFENPQNDDTRKFLAATSSIDIAAIKTCLEEKQTLQQHLLI